MARAWRILPSALTRFLFIDYIWKQHPTPLLVRAQCCICCQGDTSIPSAAAEGRRCWGRALVELSGGYDGGVWVGA